MNLRDAPLEAADAPARFAFRSTSVREALGGEKLGCTLYELDEGKQLWPYHLHWNNEEWLLVVGGAPTLRTPEGERALRPGDLVAFPEGEAGAHTLLGPGRVAIFSTRNQGATEYPDTHTLGWGPPWKRKYLSASAEVDYWEGT